MESNHVLKKRYSYGNGDFTKCNYKYMDRKDFTAKRGHNCSSLNRTLPAINGIDLKSINDLVDILCINLHEHNKDLMCKL